MCVESTSKTCSISLDINTVSRAFSDMYSTMADLSRATVPLKGQSHEIRVCFFWAQEIEKVLLIFPPKGFS